MLWQNRLYSARIPSIITNKKINLQSKRNLTQMLKNLQQQQQCPSKLRGFNLRTNFSKYLHAFLSRTQARVDEKGACDMTSM